MKTDDALKTWSDQHKALSLTVSLPLFGIWVLMLVVAAVVSLLSLTWRPRA